MADKLRSMGCLPMIFDFDRPMDRDLTETVKILAGRSRLAPCEVSGVGGYGAQHRGLEGWDTDKAVQLLMTGKGPSGQPQRPPTPQHRMNRDDAAAVVAYLKSSQ